MVANGNPLCPNEAQRKKKIVISEHVGNAVLPTEVVDPDARSALLSPLLNAYPALPGPIECVQAMGRVVPRPFIRNSYGSVVMLAPPVKFPEVAAQHEMGESAPRGQHYPAGRAVSVLFILDGGVQASSNNLLLAALHQNPRRSHDATPIWCYLYTVFPVWGYRNRCPHSINS